MKWFHQYYKYFAASVEYPLSNVISYANSPTSQNPHVKPNQNLNTSLTLICTCHTCAYAQCLSSTFLTKPLTPPCANQGFAYAKCSYDKALIKTIQNGFWGRSTVSVATLVHKTHKSTRHLRLNMCQTFSTQQPPRQPCPTRLRDMLSAFVCALYCLCIFFVGMQWFWVWRF